MKQFLMMILLGTVLIGCAIQKPPLSETQVVDGKSIIIPPEFDTLPTVTKTEKGK